MSIKFAVRLNKKKRIPRIDVLRSSLNETAHGTKVKKYDTLGTIQQFGANNVDAFAKEKNIDGQDKMELEEGVCQLAFNKRELNSSLEDLERKTLYFSENFNKALYKLWKLGKKHQISFCPADIMQEALLEKAIEMEYRLNECEKKSIHFLKEVGIKIEYKEPIIETPLKMLEPLKRSASAHSLAIGSLDSLFHSWQDDDEEENYVPKRDPSYDFKKSEAYKSYRKEIREMTVKGTGDFLSGFSNYKTIESLLNTREMFKIGETLLLLRADLIGAGHLSKRFKKDQFVISKTVFESTHEDYDYTDTLFMLLSEFFGCDTAFITSGKKEPMVITGHCDNVKVAFQVYQLIANFLKEEFSNIVEKSHKNMKRKNKYSRAGWRCEDMAYDLLKPISDENGEVDKLLNEEQETQLRDYTDKRVGRYYDENMPLGGWKNW